MENSYQKNTVTQRPIDPRPIIQKPILPKTTVKQPIVNQFVEKETIVTMTSGQSVIGKLLETDSHGVLLEAIIQEDEDNAEVAEVYIPHRAVLMLHRVK